MGEDQHPAGPRGLDEADRGDRLAGAGRVLEPEAARGAGILGSLRDRVLVRLLDEVLRLLVYVERLLVNAELVVLGTLAVPVRAGLLVGVGLRGAAGGGAARRALAVAAAVGALRLGDQLGERPRQRVDLMRGQLGAVLQLRRLLGEQPLEPQQQRVAAAPLDRGLLAAGVDLGQGAVERQAARGSRRQRLGPFAFEQERFAGKLSCPLDV